MYICIGIALVTKAEFDSAFSDIYSRVTTFEANVDNKIDSQVVSSVEKCLDVKQSGYVGELLFGLTLRDNCLLSNADGSYVTEAEKIYKDGGEVRPKSITAYGWIRIS